MKSIIEQLNDSININEQYNQRAGIRGMELIPVVYHDDPSMIIGTAVHIDETKNINRIITAASAIGLTAPKLDADYLEEYEMEYDENERYILLYCLTNGRYPDLIWIPVSEGSIDYDF